MVEREENDPTSDLPSRPIQVWYAADMEEKAEQKEKLFWLYRGGEDRKRMRKRLYSGFVFVGTLLCVVAYPSEIFELILYLCYLSLFLLDVDYVAALRVNAVVILALGIILCIGDPVAESWSRALSNDHAVKDFNRTGTLNERHSDKDFSRRLKKPKYMFELLNGHLDADLAALRRVSPHQLACLPSSVSKIVKKLKEKELEQRILTRKKKKENFLKELKADFDKDCETNTMTRKEFCAKINPRVYVIEFDWRTKDIDSLLKELTDMVSIIVAVATKFDEVVLLLASPGGSVISYGFAASQLKRLTNVGIKLTVCVDEIAASGGYMMACVADRFIIAPFAITGSIGVVTEYPNVNKVLKRNEIEYNLVTAGKCKRSMHMLAEETKEMKKEMLRQINEIHGAFIDHVVENRKHLNETKSEICTGGWWLGEEAVRNGSADEVGTSQSYLQTKMLSHDVIRIRKAPKPKRISLLSRLLGADSMWKSFIEIIQQKFRGNPVSAMPLEMTPIPKTENNVYNSVFAKMH